MPDAQARAWGTLVELHQLVPDHWTIVGRQMGYAHCMDRGVMRARPTMDADTGLDVRARAKILYVFSRALKDLGFTPERNKVACHESHWQRDGERVDVMIPTGQGFSGGTAPLPSMLARCSGPSAATLSSTDFASDVRSSTGATSPTGSIQRWRPVANAPGGRDARDVAGLGRPVRVGPMRREGVRGVNAVGLVDEGHWTTSVVLVRSIDD